ncbi:MAG TPA: hypothetical protein VFD15_05445 [Clostridia bacterium]|nr:hypothetical protein [Clostridia bacterium]
MTNSHNEVPLPPEWGKLRRGPAPIGDPPVGTPEGDTSEGLSKGNTGSVSKATTKVATKVASKGTVKTASRSVVKAKVKGERLGRGVKHTYLDRLLDRDSLLKGIVLAEALGPPRCRKKNPYKFYSAWGYSKNDK